MLSSTFLPRLHASSFLLWDADAQAGGLSKPCPSHESQQHFCAFNYPGRHAEFLPLLIFSPSEQR